MPKTYGKLRKVAEGTEVTKPKKWEAQKGGGDHQGSVRYPPAQKKGILGGVKKKKKGLGKKETYAKRMNFERE